MLARGFWTPDEPREADIAWRMSWQTDRAVPSLAGEAFCEKPPMTYWLSAASMDALGARDAAGARPWAARLPNLLYALVGALAIGLLARRAAGPLAGAAAAAAASTFLLSYQVSIWLATDAPLLAAVALALYGEYCGFHAVDRRERLRGYLLMHAALAFGFLCKSAAAWMVPALTLAVLVVWEKRWRELLRWELYLGLPVQCAAIGAWIWFVYVGDDGAAHLKVFFWNNLVGRFTSVDAPAELQYTVAHRNAPGKYLLELPLYVWPWSLLCVAAARRAWRLRGQAPPDAHAVRFAAAVFLPSLAFLSLAATARNIYLAPALPGIALLLGWWLREIAREHDAWDLRALHATAALLGLGVLVVAAAAVLIAMTAQTGLESPRAYVAASVLGLGAAAGCIGHAWRDIGRRRLPAAALGLLLAYCSLLVGPASQVYVEVDRWQDLAAVGAAVRADLGDRELVLFAPDETTRAWVDMYTDTAPLRIPGPIDAAALDRLKGSLAGAPTSLVLLQLEGRSLTAPVRALAARVHLDLAVPAPDPAWISAMGLVVSRRYALPNGRRYALLAGKPLRFALTRQARETAPRTD